MKPKRPYRDQLYLLPTQRIDASGWLDRHLSAVTCPRAGHERALVQMLTGWLGYADAHQSAYQSGVGSDGVLGPEWAHIGACLRALLNGELGRLDGGTLDRVLVWVLEAEGFDPDTL